MPPVVKLAPGFRATNPAHWPWSYCRPDPDHLEDQPSGRTSDADWIDFLARDTVIVPADEAA